MPNTVRRKPWDKNQEEKADGLRVIGAGLPRTGTSSLKAALEILGFGPCHHMQDLFEKPNRSLEFTRAYDGENVDFHELMKGYRSTLNAPTTEFYKEIHQAYPKAKIILSVRDNGEKWFESYQSTVRSIATSDFYCYCVYLLRTLRLQDRVGRKSMKKLNRLYGVIEPSSHDLHNKRVIEENKESEVLVLNVKEGWSPLCKFLEVDIPQDIPFPNTNEAKEFKRNIIFAKTLGVGLWTVVSASVVLLSYFVIRMM